MSGIAEVHCDPPTFGPFLAEWSQPYRSGDDATAWFVGAAEVDRRRLTDEIYYCYAMVPQGTTDFSVVTGTTGSPAAAWTTPTLTGFKVTWTGHDGSIAVADLTSTAVEDVLHSGHNIKIVRRWTHSVVTVQGGSSTQIVGTQVAGHHLYMHYRADQPDVVECYLFLSNASTKIKTDGTGFLERTHAAGGMFGTFGFTDCVLTPPTGWTALSNRPLATSADIPATINGYVSNAHAFPFKMGTVRRIVIYKTATIGASQAANGLIQKLGWGRATSAGLRSFHTERAYGPAKSLLPDLALGYPGGYAGAESDALSLFGNLNSRVSQGIAIGDGGSLAPRMGLFHPAGEADPQGVGGTDVQTFAALQQVRNWARYCQLYADLGVDSNGVFMFNRTTGRPIKTSDFGNAYTDNTAPTEFFVDQSPQWLGRQPFVFYCQNNGGYEYNSAHQWYARGWIAPEWPTHFLDVENQSVPSGAWSHSTPRWLPTVAGQTGHVATASRTLNSFTCRYRPVLEYVMRFHSTSQSTSLPLYYSPQPYNADSPFASTGLGTVPFKDPNDSQHATRMYQKLITSAYLLGDVLAIDLIDCYAEWFALEYSEVGHVPRRYAGNYPDDEHTPAGETLNSDISPNTFSLLKRLQIQQAAPQTARYGAGRAEGWVGTLFAAQYALASVARRETGYTASRPYGIKKRCEMFYDFLRLGFLPNGASYRLTAGAAAGQGQLNNAFVGDPTFGPTPPPISTAFSIMQIGLELPIVHWAVFSLGKQLVRQEHEPQVMQAFRNYTAITSRYTNYSSDASVFGPPKYWAVWENATATHVPGQSAQWYGSGSGTPGYPNHQTLVELAYRIQGSAAALAVANHLGHHAPGYPRQTPAQRGAQLLADGSYRGEWDSGLIALLLTSPGPDVAPAPPTSTPPSVFGSASPNPVAAGETVTLFAQVTPGANPASTAIEVTVDLSALGIVSPLYDMLDDGVDPDETAGDLIFTTELDTTGLVPATYSFPVKVLDGEGRRNTGELVLTIVGATVDPVIASVTVEPNPVALGAALIVRALVFPGSAPPSTGLTVKIDLSQLGGSATASMLDGGIAPDTTAGDDEYAVSITVDPGTVVGPLVLPISVLDDQLRHASGMASVSTYEVPVPATNPQVVLIAAGTPITPGSTLTLLGVVTAGTGPTSTGLTVTADLTELGGRSEEALLDDGVAPDVTADDLTFTAEYEVPSDTAAGVYAVSATVTDAERRTGSMTIKLEVIPLFVETFPTISPAASPNPVTIGQTVILTATVVAGTSPSSTGIQVTMDLSPIGGPAAKVLSDSGVAPDASAADLVYTGSHFIGHNTPTGRSIITARVVDAQGREDRKTFILYVNPIPPPILIPIPDHPVSTMYDTLTHSTARISEGGSAKILRYVRNGLNAALLQANVSAFQVDVYDVGGTQPEVPIWSTGRLEATAQNADGTVIVKSAVVVDGQSPSRAGHTFEFLLDAATAGLHGDKSYSFVVSFTLIEPAITVFVTIPLACDEVS